MIECNFRSHGIYGIKKIPDDTPKMYCSMRTHDTHLTKDGKKVSGTVKVNSLCSGEDNCFLFQIYKKLFEPPKPCMWGIPGCKFGDKPHGPSECTK